MGCEAWSRARKEYMQAVDSLDVESRASRLPLPLAAYRKYGRQMMLNDFGIRGQSAIAKASILIVGAGGLGCPALLYLAAAGIGHISILDHDVVDVSNLHRQILHTEARIGMLKAESARIALLERDTSTNVSAITWELTPDTCGRINFSAFDVIVDCTDNAPTRYLLNDLCVTHGKQLVSGAAIRMDGQVAVWNKVLSTNDASQRGPCYRCVFPFQQDESTSERCDDEGVLGTITGTIGTLVATEVVKILLGTESCEPFLLQYSPLNVPPLRYLKLRKSSSQCMTCGVYPSSPSISSLHSVMTYCAPNSASMLTEDRITATEAARLFRNEEDVLLIDTRPAKEFQICSLPFAINIPAEDSNLDVRGTLQSLAKCGRVLVVCRRGNDSVRVVKALQMAGFAAADIIGGLEQWALQVDRAFPIY